LTLSLLIVEKVEKVYDASGGVAALRGVSFELDQGDFVALMGPSGCGKSTLLHIVGGVDRPTRGSVSIAGQRLEDLDEEALTRLRRKRIGFVFQFFNLLPTLTIDENVKLPLMLEGISEQDARRRSVPLLERVGLAARGSHYPAQLSGGEMQRTAVARAVIAEPELLLADEPTGNLDTENGEQVMQLLAELNRELKVSIILATHSDQAANYARRTIRMRDGIVEQVIERESLLQTL
jgi:putative ABC transport system ATP-binding protein